MPRTRPGKKERAVKRTQDQRALDELNDRIQAERTSKKQLPEKLPGDPLHTTTGDNRISKQTKPDRTYTSSEVDAIVQAAVTAAVSTTVAAIKALLSGDIPKQPTTVSKTAGTLAERITSKKTLADRISFPKKN
jgi:hypothetical protein